jgi:uncharacterized protein
MERSYEFDVRLTRDNRMEYDYEYDPFVITFYYHSDVLYGFIAQGSTGFSHYGLDIVAAGVSALILNTMNSLQHLSKDAFEMDARQNYAKCLLSKKGASPSREASVLLQALEIGIHSIQNTYGEKYVIIEKSIDDRKPGLWGWFGY